MPQTTTHLLAFQAPVVKTPDLLAVPVLTGAGEWGELLCSPELLRSLGGAIRDYFTPQKLRPARRKKSARRAPLLKPGGRIL